MFYSIYLLFYNRLTFFNTSSILGKPIEITVPFESPNALETIGF